MLVKSTNIVGEHSVGEYLLGSSEGVETRASKHGGREAETGLGCSFCLF